MFSDVRAADGLYEGISFSSEMAIIIDALPEIKAAIRALVGEGTVTVNTLLEAVQGIKVDASLVPVAEAALAVVNKLITLDTADHSLGLLRDIIVEKVPAVEALLDNYTRDQAIADARTLLAIAELVVESGIAEQALTDVKSIVLDSTIEEILDLVQDLYVIENNYSGLAVYGINTVLAKFTELTVTEDLYAEISFASEMDIIIDALPELEAVVKALTGKDVV